MYDHRKLRQQLVNSFSETEIRTLCFDLHVNYDALAGTEINGKVISLLDYAEKNGRLSALFTWCAEERPNLDWSQFQAVPVRSNDFSRLPAQETTKVVTTNPLPYWTLPYGEPDWVEIPAGEFWMGSENDYDNEKPIHRVYLDTFWIARTPITNTQYQFFVQTTQHRAPSHWQDGNIPPGLENHPVVWVTWYDAMDYCQWLSEVTGKAVTLPGEAEWEKAARGDKDKREYPWGDTFAHNRANSEEAGVGMTTPVDKYPGGGASPFGVVDMVGNVWEWTRNLWGPDVDKSQFQYPYNPTDGRENLHVGDEVRRIFRGGSWAMKGQGLRCARRAHRYPRYGDGLIGFRVCHPPFFTAGL